MAQITEYLANNLDTTVEGKALDARVGQLISRTVIPSLKVRIVRRDYGLGYIAREINVRHQTNVSSEFMSYNPVIVLMKKKRKASSYGHLAGNKWVEVGEQKTQAPNKSDYQVITWTGTYLGPVYQHFIFRTEISDYYLSTGSEKMTVEKLMNGFIAHNINVLTQAHGYTLMGSNKKNIIINGREIKSKVAKFGLAVRIDNPRFREEILKVNADNNALGRQDFFLRFLDNSSFFNRQPKYLYGEICKLGFRAEYASDGLIQHIVI